MPTATVNGFDFHFAERGAGPPLVLVHGFPLNHRMWDAQIAALSPRCRVIASDMRGFGESGVAHGTLSMDQFADDLAGLLDALRIEEPVILCGLSMGGYIAFRFFARHRSRLAALILCDTRAAADSPEARQNRRKLAEAVLKHGSESAVKAMLDKLISRHTAEDRPEVPARLIELIVSAAPPSIAAALSGMSERPDSTPLLSEIDLPALLICGEHDVLTPSDEMQRMAAAIPNAGFVEIRHAGHMTPMERPDEFNGAVESFLDSLQRD